MNCDVFVEGGTGCPAFGSITLFPISQSEAALQVFLGRYRKLVQHLSIAVIGIGEGTGPFVDPVYDPPKGERVGITGRQIDAMIHDSKLLTVQLENWARVLKKENHRNEENR